MKAKIVLATSAFVVLFMSVAFFSGLSYFEHHLKGFIFDHEAALASSMADELDSKIATFQAEVIAVARRVTPELLQDRAKAQRFMNERDEAHLMFDNGFYLFLPNGRIWAGGPLSRQQLSSSYAYREYFKETMATKKPYISEPYRTSQQHHHPVVMFTAPILDDHGEVMAFIGGSIDLLKANFLGKLASARIGKSGYFAVVNGKRLIIVHPMQERLLRDTVPPGSNRLLDRAFDGFEETGETVTSLGVPMVSSFKRLKTTGWILSANSPRAEAYAAINQAKRFILIAVPIVLLFSMVCVWLLMGKLTAPLTRFTEHVKKVTTDDEQKPIQVETDDELGALAVAFNKMLAELGIKKQTVQEQLRFLQILIDTIPAPVFYKDMTGRYLGCNTAFTKFVNLDRTQIIGKTAYDIAPGELARIYHTFDLKLMEQQGTQIYESQIGNGKGKHQNVIFYKALFTNAAGTPEGLVGVILDITERKRVEERVRDMGERFQQLFSQNWDAILLLSPGSFRILDANPAAERLLGFGTESGLVELSSILASEDMARLTDLIAGAAADTVQLDKAVARSKTGTELTVSIRCKIVRAAGDEIIYCSFRDISEKIRLEKEMKETQAKLIHANRMTSLGVLTAGIAHEINNPNSYIAANATLLVEAWNDALPLLAGHVEENGEIYLGGLPFSEMQEIIPRLCSGLTEGSRRISTIIDNLRGFYRQPNSSLPAAFDINKAVGDAVAILSHHVHKHTNNFSLCLGEGIPQAAGRSQQIEQVVVNLIMNSLQALSKKAEAVYVATSFHEETGLIEITVKDEGKGMTAEVLERLTEPFFSTRLDEGGTGLGLSISETIIKEHGGNMSFTSTPGSGTTATLRLPAAAKLVAPISTGDGSCQLTAEYQI